MERGQSRAQIVLIAVIWVQEKQARRLMADQAQAHGLEKEERVPMEGLKRARDFLPRLLIKMCGQYNERAYEAKRW